jgi:hypothetical protein
MSFIIEKKYAEDFLVSTSTVSRRQDYTVKYPWIFMSGGQGQLGKKVQGYMDTDGQHIHAFRFFKQRKRTQQTKIVNGEGDVYPNTTESQKIRDGHWIVQHFMIPTSRIKHFVQHARHFDAILY